MSKITTKTLPANSKLTSKKNVNLPPIKKRICRKDPFGYSPSPLLPQAAKRPDQRYGWNKSPSVNYVESKRRNQRGMEYWQEKVRSKLDSPKRRRLGHHRSESESINNNEPCFEVITLGELSKHISQDICNFQL